MSAIFKYKILFLSLTVILIVGIAVFVGPLVQIEANSTVSTTIFLTSSVNPSNVNQLVTFTAVVTPTPDGGTVQFQNNGTDLGVPMPLNNSGQAIYTTSTLATGSRNITAVYSGDNNFGPSTSSIIETIPNPNWDINGDGVCNYLDLTQLGLHWGETYQSGYVGNNDSITGASVDGNGNLNLTLASGGTLDAGSVVGPQGPAGPAGETPTFGSWQGGTVSNNNANNLFNLNTIYQASSDGFIVVSNSVCAEFGGIQNTIVTGMTGSNPNSLPTIATIGSDYGNAPSPIFYDDSFTMPVKKGDYWEVTGQLQQFVTITVNWLPFGN